MQQPPGVDPHASSSDLGSESGLDLVAASPGGWRLLLAPLLLFPGVGAFLVLQLGVPVPVTLPAGAASAPPAAVVPPLAAPDASIGGLPADRASRSEVAVSAPPTALPTPAPSPAPVPTPDPDVRPLVGPAMPRVVDFGPPPVRKPDVQDPDPSTDHVIVVDGESGAVLFQRNAYEPVAPASLTKIMTALVGLERGDLNEPVKVDVDARQMPGSSLMGLEPWFDVTFRDLLYGLMLPSGNDAALAIARYVARTDDKFVALMNEEARRLGLRSTHFANPHGLDTPDHYSSPADMVAIARYAMQNPEFRRVVSTRFYQVKSSNLNYELENVNAILGYEGADGVKTGFTDSAGRALVATAVRDGHRIYVAFMRSESGAWVDGSLLLDWAFNSFTWPRGGKDVGQ